jgi:hypothetical protein
LGMLQASDPGQVLVVMTAWINRVLADAWMPKFDINRYIDAAQIGMRLDYFRPSWWPQP